MSTSIIDRVIVGTSAHSLSGRSMRSSENSGGPAVSLRMRRSRSAMGRDGLSNWPICSTAKSSILTESRRASPRGSTDDVEGKARLQLTKRPQGSSLSANFRKVS